MKKLTKKMTEVLAELAKPDATANYMRYMGRFGDAYYYLSENHAKCTAQVTGLIHRRLLTWVPDGQFGDGHAEINEAGRKILKELGE